jgi:amino acid transporter
MYINAAVQDGLYSAATLSPLASINFFSKKITATNKKGIPVKSIVTFVGIILIFDFILLIIPDFIQGFKTLGCYNDYGDSREGHIKAISLSKEPFDVSSLSQAAGAMALCLYAISFLCLLNLELKNNKKN